MSKDMPSQLNYEKDLSTHDSQRNVGTAIGFLGGISLIAIAILRGANPEVFLNPLCANISETLYSPLISVGR